MPTVPPAGIARALAGSSAGARIVLCHGSNEELRADVFVAVRKSAGVSIDDAFRFVRIDGDEVDSDPGRIADELGAISMFGGSRLIEVRASARQAEKIVSQALQSSPNEWTLLIGCPDLSEADWLSSLTKNPALLVVGCGDENAGDFHAFVMESLRHAGIEADSAAVELLIQLVGEERSGIRGEVDKLALLLGSAARVTESDVREVVANASSTAADDVAAAAFSGDAEALSSALDRLTVAGSDSVQALNAALRAVLNMHKGRVRQWGGRPDSGWSAADLRRMTRSLSGAVLQSRTDSANAGLLAERSLVALCLAARQRRR